jgi:hypothetical protein
MNRKNSTKKMVRKSALEQIVDLIPQLTVEKFHPTEIYEKLILPLTKTYQESVSLLVSTIGEDIWSQVIDQIRCNNNNFISDILSLRAISKCWNNTVAKISKIEIPGELCNNQFRFQNIVRLFPNLNSLQILYNCSLINFSNFPKLLELKLTPLTPGMAKDCGHLVNYQSINDHYQQLSTLTSLKMLSIAENPFVTNEGLAKLTNLEYLDLSRNSVIENTTLTNLTKLKKLELVENELITFEGVKDFSEDLEVLGTKPIFDYGRRKFTCVSPTGSFIYRYEGDFWDNKAHGFGRIVWATGNTYKGDWCHGKMYGIGEYKWATGSQYYGEWVQGKEEGKGTFTWPDGSQYTGDWVKGNKQGRGRYTWSNCDFYFGEFRNNKREGYGTKTIANGGKIEGYWKEGKYLGHNKDDIGDDTVQHNDICHTVGHCSEDMYCDMDFDHKIEDFP